MTVSFPLLYSNSFPILAMTNEPFVKIDLHGLHEDEAIKVIDQAIKNAGTGTYHLELIHGYHRGTSLRSMIYDWYQSHPQFKRIIPGDNPGMTILVMKELY